MKQLNLFQNEYKPQGRPPYYMELSIHEKINVRSNYCGFGKILYLTDHRYKRFTIRHDDVTTHLTERYFWHYKMNCNRSIETIIYLRELLEKPLENINKCSTLFD